MLGFDYGMFFMMEVGRKYCVLFYVVLIVEEVL